MKQHGTYTILFAILSLIIGIVVKSITDNEYLGLLITPVVFIIFEVIKIGVLYDTMNDEIVKQKATLNESILPFLGILDHATKNSSVESDIINQFSNMFQNAHRSHHHIARQPALSHALKEVSALFHEGSDGYCMRQTSVEAIYKALAKSAKSVYIWEPDLPSKDIKYLYSSTYVSLFLEKSCASIKEKHYVYTATKSEHDSLKDRTQELSKYGFKRFRISRDSIPDTKLRNTPESFLLFEHEDNYFSLVSVVPFFKPRGIKTTVQIDEQNFFESAGMFIGLETFKGDDDEDATSKAKRVHAMIAKTEKEKLDYGFRSL